MGVELTDKKHQQKKYQQKWLTNRRRARLPTSLRRTTSESPSRPRRQRPSTRHATRLSCEPRLSTPEVASRVTSKSRDPDPCQLDACESPPERRHAVKVPRPGIDTRCESTSE